MVILVIFLSVFTISCKKNQVSEKQIQPVSLNHLSNSGLSIPISAEVSSLLDSILLKRKLTKEDFRGLIDSLNLVKSGKTLPSIIRTMSDEDDQTEPSEDPTVSAVMDDQQDGEEEGDNSFNSTRRINSKFQANVTFPIRQNSMQIIVPFKYDLGLLPNAGTNTINNLQQSMQVQLLPAGIYWGEVTQGTVWYVNGGTSTNQWQQSAGVSAFGTMQEKRTRIISTTGRMKISTDVNVEVFTVGSELENGFTIQSASNIYNQYNMTATGQIFISQSTNPDGLPPILNL